MGECFTGWVWTYETVGKKHFRVQAQPPEDGVAFRLQVMRVSIRTYIKKIPSASSSYD